MSRNDDSRTPRDGMTPSGWHDDAYQRDAGHDEMQAAWWREVRESAPRSIEHREYGVREYAYSGSWVEHPFVATGRLIGFADVATLYRSTETHYVGHAYVPYDWWLFYEIKPRIHSVGALIRQCKATAVLAERCALSGEVIAVVYDDDPKLVLLRELAGFAVKAIPRPAVSQHIQEDRP